MADSHRFPLRGLEAAACECYGIVQKQWDRMLTPEALESLREA